MKTEANPRSDRLYNILEKAEDFFIRWEKSVWVDDKRSGTMPSCKKGIVIGVTHDRVLIRFNNVISSWMPITHNLIEYFFDSLTDD
jgi:hypothetical protein